MYPSKDETALWVALNLAQRSTHRITESALTAAGLPSMRWYDILWSLERTSGGLRPFEFEKKLILEQSNLSRLTQRMIAEGLVEEQVYEKDRRGKVLHITEKGKDIRKRMWEVYGPLIHEHMAKVADQYDAKLVSSALKEMISEGELTDPF